MKEKDLRIELAFRRIEDIERSVAGLRNDIIIITQPENPLDYIDDDIDLDKESDNE